MSAPAHIKLGTIGRPTAKAPVRPKPFTWSITPAAQAAADGAFAAEVTVYGYIGEDRDWMTGEELGVTAQKFLDEVRAIPNLSLTDLTVRVNSPGGDAWTGSAIFTVLSSLACKSKTVIVDGLAASAASVIAMAGDRILMPRNALMMIHEASTWFFGDLAAMAKAQEMLVKLNGAMVTAYASKNTTKTEEEIAALMAATTWMTADEAVAMGFADEVIEPVEATALVHEGLEVYASLPEPLIAAQAAAVVVDDLETQIAAAVALAVAEAKVKAEADKVPPPAADPEADKKAREEAEAQAAAEAAIAADALVRSKIRATAVTYGIAASFDKLAEQLTPLAEPAAVTAKLKAFVFEASVEAALKTEIASTPEPELPSQRTAAAAITHQVVADVYAARRKTLQGDT